MGFHDTYVDTGGATFISSAEKNELIAEGTVITVSGVGLRDGKYGEEYTLKCEVADAEGESRVLTFPTGAMASRDEMLAALKVFLEGPEGEPTPFILKKVGDRGGVILADPDGD